MDPRPPTWRDYMRGLTVEAAAAAPSSCSVSAELAMSGTNGKPLLSSRGRRKAARRGDPSSPKTMDGRVTPRGSSRSPGHDERGNGGTLTAAGIALLGFGGERRFATILADPP